MDRLCRLIVKNPNSYGAGAWERHGANEIKPETITWEKMNHEAYEKIYRNMARV